MELLLFILVTFFQLLIGIVASVTKLEKDKKASFPLNLSVNGWLLMLGFILCFGFSITLFIVSDDKRENSEKEVSRKDSLYKLHIDSIHYNTVELLAKYGLKVDSSQNQIIQAIKDSSKKETVIINEKNPVLTFCNESLKFIRHVNDSADFEVGLCCSYSTAKKIQAKIYCVVFENQKYRLLDGVVHAFYDDTMMPENWSRIPIAMDGVRSINQFVFIAVGTFYNADLTRQLNLVETIAYFANSKKTGELTGENKIKLFEYLKSKGIKMPN